MTQNIDPKREKANRERLPAWTCRYLTERELAQRWGVDERTLQGHRQKGGYLAFYTFGGSVKYRKREIYAFERAARRTSTSDKGPGTPT